MAIHFREFAGTYMEHCHNTQHEDNSMLLRWDIEHPGQFQLMPTPMPTWDGVGYVSSAALPTYHNGDGTGPTVKLAAASGSGASSGGSGSGSGSGGSGSGGSGSGSSGSGKGK
jgi:hypothetical protein